MKKLILLDTPIIVSDEKLKVFDNFFFQIDDIYDILKVESEFHLNRIKDIKENFKIIAGLPELPQIDFNEFEEHLGIVDVEKLSIEHCKPDYDKFGGELEYVERQYWIRGFQAAQKLNEKKFSLEDMKKCYEGVLQNVGTSIKKSDLPSTEEYIKYLSQPKIFDIEVEMESVRMECNESRCIIPCACYHQGKPTLCESGNTIWEPKITNNRIKITKIL